MRPGPMNTPPSYDASGEPDSRANDRSKTLPRTVSYAIRRCRAASAIITDWSRASIATATGSRNMPERIVVTRNAASWPLFVNVAELLVTEGQLAKFAATNHVTLPPPRSREVARGMLVVVMRRGFSPSIAAKTSYAVAPGTADHVSSFADAVPRMGAAAVHADGE